VRLAESWCGIPADPEVEVDLTGVQYGYSPKQQIQLEKKEDMKARAEWRRPDLGNPLAMSLAVTVQPKPTTRWTSKRRRRSRG
jgi:hypothetical protein